LGESGFSRNPQSLSKLLDTIYLVSQGPDWVLQSSHPKIKGQKPRLSGDELVELITKSSTGMPSLQDTLVNGLVELCKVKPAGNDAILWLGQWLLENNPSKPRVEIPE
jgi:hypothetical protein